MMIQTCTILFHRIFKVSETDFNMFFLCVCFCLVPCHSLLDCLSLWLVALSCAVRWRVCVHAISCTVPLCLSCGLSAHRACVHVCLPEWVCVCLPEWNVSLISLLLLEGRRGGLYSVISASLWPPLSPWCTWEHTCRSYIEAFKHLSLTLFHYNHKTFRFLNSFTLFTVLWNCGWRVTNCSVKSIMKRAFDWLIVCDGLACEGMD